MRPRFPKQSCYRVVVHEVYIGALYGLPNPPWVDSGRWRGMIDDLVTQRLVDVEEKRFRGIPDNELKEAKRHSAFLEDVFLGQAISLNMLDRMAPWAAKGMLFVLGGSDDLGVRSSNLQT